LFGYYIDYHERKTRQLGREQHLAQEAQKFDRLIEHPTPLPALIVGAVFVLGLFAFVYEIVVIVIFAVLKSKKPTADTSIPFS
jgi:hypothetical protein